MMEKERRGTAQAPQLTFTQLPKPCPNCLGDGWMDGWTDEHTHTRNSVSRTEQLRSPGTPQNAAGYKAPEAESSYSLELLLWYY